MGLSMPWCMSVGAAYFVQGVKMSLGTLTEQYYLKDDLHFSPAQASAEQTLFGSTSDLQRVKWLLLVGQPCQLVCKRCVLLAGGHLESNCAHPLGGEAVVWLFHGHIPYSWDEAPPLHCHLRDCRCTSC